MATPEEMALAMSGGARKNVGDDKLAVLFYRKSVPDEVESAKEGRPRFKETPYVKICTPGDIINVVDRPVFDTLPDGRSDPERFPQQWAAFKAGLDQEKAKGGTPLDKLPGVTQPQVEELKHFKVRTIEDLANLDDAIGQRFMGIQTLKQRAQRWLEATAGNAPLEKMQVALSQRDDLIAQLSARLSALEAAPKNDVRGLQEQAAELAAHEAGAELEQARRGPGRPPKAK